MSSMELWKSTIRGFLKKKSKTIFFLIFTLIYACTILQNRCITNKSGLSVNEQT